MENRVIKWKYFVGWKLFMYVAFILVYLNCFYFVRQHSVLKEEISNLQGKVAELENLNAIKNNEPEVLTEISEEGIYAILKDIDETTIEIDYVQLLGGVESNLANQEDSECYGDTLNTCGEAFYVRNLNEKENSFKLEDDATFSLLSMESGVKTDNASVSKNEFINQTKISDRKDFFVVKIDFSYNSSLDEYQVKSVDQVYTP